MRKMLKVSLFRLPKNICSSTLTFFIDLPLFTHVTSFAHRRRNKIKLTSCETPRTDKIGLLIDEVIKNVYFASITLNSCASQINIREMQFSVTQNLPKIF